MIKVIITSIVDLKEEDAKTLILNLPNAVKDKINGTNNEKLKKHRIGAYIALDFLYREMFEKERGLPNIEYTKKGKPYFTNCENVSFSISHDENYTAVAICDTGRDIGIDIQAMPKKKGRLERIAQRFLSVFKRDDFVYNAKQSMKENSPQIKQKDISYFFITLDRDAKAQPVNDIAFLPKEENASYDYLTKWTLLEATLKMDGSGFEKYKNAEDIISSAKNDIKVFIGEDDIPYSVAVAVN